MVECTSISMLYKKKKKKKRIDFMFSMWRRDNKNNDYKVWEKLISNFRSISKHKFPKWVPQT